MLSAAAFAYPKTSDGQLADIPPGVPIKRAFALDSSRHLALAGRHISATARPDRWITWKLGAIPAGIRLIKKYRPVAIWSTYPIATAHSIGAALHRFSNLPWICDFRDPMVEFDKKLGQWFPGDKADRSARLRVEKTCVDNASRLIFCTDSAMDICTSRYSQIVRDRCHVVANGFDESIFAEIENNEPIQVAEMTSTLKMVHSGTLYPGDDRDPSAFFQALHRLKSEGVISHRNLQVTLRATGFDHVFAPKLDELNLRDIVSLAPAVDYRHAITEMLNADALLLFQGRTSDPAIPAKLYEYLRCQKPILAFVHEGGETSRLLGSLNVGLRSTMDDVDAIRQSIVDFITKRSNNDMNTLSAAKVASMSREARAHELQQIVRAAAVSGTGKPG